MFSFAVCCTPAVQFGLTHLKSNLSSLAIRKVLNVRDGSLSELPGNQGYFWCTRHLSSSFGVIGDGERCWPIPLCPGSWSAEEGVLARARWDPIWTDPTSCQLSPQWLGMLPARQQPSKGACPPVRHEWAARSTNPSLHYWGKEVKAGSYSFNPRVTLQSAPC